MTYPNQMWSAPSPAGLIEAKKTNWVLATLVGLAVGAVAALAYAWISALIEGENLWLIIAVGAIIGFVVMSVAKVDNVTTGLLAVGIAAVSLSFAIYLLFGGGVPDAFEYFGEYGLADAFEGYFSDPLGYLWVGASLVAAFVVGSGLSKKGKPTTQAPTGPQVMPRITPPDPSSETNPSSDPYSSGQPPQRTF